MKSHPPTIFLALAAALLFAASSSQAQTNLTNGSWNVTISSAAGGTKTAISFFATGDWATNGFLSDVTALPPQGSPGFGIAASGIDGAPPNAWNFATTNISVGTFGYYTNNTSGASTLLDQLRFGDNGSFQVLAVVGPGPFPFNTGDWLQFVFDATPVELEIDLAFTNFNPGTYNGVSSRGTQFNMEIVPEPSTYALLALSAAGLGGFVLRRRRK